MTATSDGCASSTRCDPIGPPYLFADASHWQGESPDWKLIASYCTGIILKATQGLHYTPSWFVRHWQAVRDVGGDRYGSTWLRGAYHYLDFFASGARQADVFLDHVDRAGGWGDGDIMPIVDVERGGGNRDADGQMVIARVEAFVERVKARTGRNVILYGRGALRELAIRSLMGCVGVWNPSQTETMHTDGLPCALDAVLLWQYTNGKSGSSNAHGCPLRLPGWKGGLDLSVAIDGARKTELERVCARLLGR